MEDLRVGLAWRTVFFWEAEGRVPFSTHSPPQQAWWVRFLLTGQNHKCSQFKEYLNNHFIETLKVEKISVYQNEENDIFYI